MPVTLRTNVKAKLTISPARVRPDDVEMKDRDGRTIYVRASATIGEMLAAGVIEISVDKPNAPLPPNWYRDTGK